MEPFIGEIKMVGFNFAPRGWALCNGQLLSIAQNSALFSLLGTTFGGDGRTTFALPNLQGRVPIHQGNGAGLTPRVMGEMSGTESHTLITTEIPAHQHTGTVSPPCAVDDATTASPQNAVPGIAGVAYTPTPSPGVTMAPASFTTGAAGGSQPHNNLQPYLVVNFVIALEGIFPSRN